jgi:hypothetical protein
MAPRKGSGEGGFASSCLMDSPPALSPKIVIFSGSPPNLAMLDRTHWRAKRWSRRPLFCSPKEISGELEKPKTVVDVG